MKKILLFLFLLFSFAQVDASEYPTKSDESFDCIVPIITVYVPFHGGGLFLTFYDNDYSGTYTAGDDLISIVPDIIDELPGGGL